MLDVNILVSALISPTGHPDAIYRDWADGRFTLLTCAEHLDELRLTLQKHALLNAFNRIKRGGW